jgi:hypothetical protein
MSFQPQIPLTGVAGWRFLERTQASQQAAFEQGASLKREVERFAAEVGSIRTAADLVGDRRLLKIALGAFGLEGEIDKKALVRKVLESDLADPRSLANRMAAPGFKEMAQAFGLGPTSTPRTGDAGFADRIVAGYKTRAFEAAVGESSNEMRLALNFRREIAALSKGETGGSWFSVLGSKPLRDVFEKAYALPKEFGRLDIDRQREVMREKTSALFGTANLSAFASPANVEKVVTRFLARAQVEAGPSATTPGSAALSLLSGAASGGSAGLLNLLAAQR